MILAIDPGTYESAYVVYDPKTGRIIHMGIIENQKLIFWITAWNLDDNDIQYCAIEFIQNQGMPVGSETFHTCRWVGKFQQAWGEETVLIYRKEVLINILGTTRTGGKSSDSLITQALIKRFGYKNMKEAKRGKLKGVKSHIWSALAVAVTYGDRLKEV